ncbi:MAG: PadR family transcriptional regulator [Anaerolineae bacterium]
MDRELLLLGALRQADMHGYRLNEFIEREMASCIEIKKPTAYALLEKMVSLGWITAHEEREGNRPPRHVYRITAEGERQFERLLRHNLAAYTPTRFTGDIGLAFADALEPSEMVDLLAERRSELAAALAEARATPAHRGTLQWLIEHHIYHLESELRWLDEIVARAAKAEAHS